MLGTAKVDIIRNTVVVFERITFVTTGSHWRILFFVVSPYTKDLGRPNIKHAKIQIKTMICFAALDVSFGAKGFVTARYRSKLSVIIVQTDTPVKTINEGRNKRQPTSPSDHGKHSPNTAMGIEKIKMQISEIARLITK